MNARGVGIGSQCWGRECHRQELNLPPEHPYCTEVQKGGVIGSEPPPNGEKRGTTHCWVDPRRWALCRGLGNVQIGGVGKRVNLRGCLWGPL